jgi:hypothetical protein
MRVGLKYPTHVVRIETNCRDGFIFLHFINLKCGQYVSDADISPSFRSAKFEFFACFLKVNHSEVDSKILLIWLVHFRWYFDT